MKSGPLPPGPKKRPRRAADGSVCPPGSEGPRVYRGLRQWHRTCRKGHEKTHPGRCIICRRASDKARDSRPGRVETKRKAYHRWEAKPGSKKKIAAWSARRNKRPDQKADNALRMRELRRGKTRSGRDPKAVAEKLLKMADQAVKMGYTGTLCPGGI